MDTPPLMRLSDTGRGRVRRDHHTVGGGAGAVDSGAGLLTI